MAPRNTYKIRKFINGKRRDGTPFLNYSLTIPSHVAEQLPKNRQFECLLTDDGILFRPVGEDEQKIKLPAWATQESNGGGKSESKTQGGKPRKRPTRKSE